MRASAAVLATGRAAVVAIACLAAGGAGAQSFRVGAGGAARVTFGVNAAFAAAGIAEVRDVLVVPGGAFGARLRVDSRPAVGVDALFRASGPTGPLYAGAGVTFAASALEASVILGYEWEVSDRVGAFLEAAPVLPFGAAFAPRVDVLAGFTFRL